MIFQDRAHAGRLLAERLSYLKNKKVVVLALPRGGLPVAFQVAAEIKAPLDVIVVRKLGVPSQPELAMGAVGEGNVLIKNSDVIKMAHISPEEFAAVEAREREEVSIRTRKFREGRSPISLKDHVALIVDDGVATGSTAQAACDVAHTLGAQKVILAVPVGSAEAVRSLSERVDEVICLEVPENFSAVGQWYEDFSPVGDEEVIQLLRKAIR